MDNPIKKELFEKLKTFGFLKIRKDLRHLEDEGMWENGVPAWVRVVQDTYQLSNPTNSLVLLTGWEFVTESLMELLPVRLVEVVGIEAFEASDVSVSPDNRVTLPPPLDSELALMMGSEPFSRINAIKAYRMRTGCLLKEAKMVLEDAITKGVDCERE